MRNTLIASFTTAVLVASLIGCSGKSDEQITADKLEDLIFQMDGLKTAAAPIDPEGRIYSVAITVEGVELPAGDGSDALYIDQALALVPAAQEIAAEGNARQKESANAILATIYADEGSYLINVADEAFEQATSQVASLRGRADVAKAILEHNKALSGDRAAVIDTIETGNIGNGDSVDGIKQLQEQVAAATRELEAAQGDLAKARDEIKQQQEKVAEFEGIDLQLKSEARSATNEVKFDKLDKATTALREAEAAEAKAESLQTDAEIAESKAALAEGRKTRGEAVIDELEAKVDKIKAERQMIADKLAELDQDRQAAITALTTAYNEMDGMVQIGGFSRMASAVDRLTKADEAINKAGLGSNGQLQQISIYTLHARALHQQALSARSYSAMLSTIAAYGPDVLGEGLNTAITQRIEELAKIEAAVKDAAAQLDEAASSTVSAVEGTIDNATPAGQTAAKQVELYRSLLASAR